MDPAFEGQAQVFHNDRLLGTVRVTIGQPAEDSDRPWEGQIIGSDYLMWGMNHKKVELALPSGARVHCVVLASGKLRGLPESP